MSDHAGVSAYPLTWPTARPRTPASQRKDPKFRTAGQGPVTMVDARRRLSDEVEMLRAGFVVLSTNLELRIDGQPRAERSQPVDPGVALYFRLKSRPIVLACDRWNTVAGNVAAIAAHIEALRGQERWGVGSIEQAFAGFTALPSAIVPDDWRAVLGQPGTLAQAEAAYRARIVKAHPDAGGSDAAAAALNAAIALARKEMT